MLGNSSRSARMWLEGRSRPGSVARRLIALAAALPLLLLADAAQPASLINSVGPRLPTNIGPRSLGPIGTVGPRLDPSFHLAPGDGSGAGGSSSGGPNGVYSVGAKSHAARRTRGGGPNSIDPRHFPDEVVFEFSGSEQQLNRLLTRLHLAALETVRVQLLNTTLRRARILDGGSVLAKIRALMRDGSVRNVQPNYRFTLVQAAEAAPTPATPVDSAQYAVAKLRLDQAHTLARGDHVLVAVVDSGIDVTHPALGGSVEASFDAVNSSEGPHSHGTAIAGIIAGHARLDGAAPAVRILAARAFSATQGSTVSIIASIDWAAAHGARVVNMSFAGPSDPALGRALAAAHQKGIVLVAASGNAGPKSPPLWPAADPHVIAVTATDYEDHLFAMANRGSHVAIAAPGVDILVATTGDGYKLESGTSFSAAFVSGVAALLVQRKPDLTPDALKKVLLATAHDLGPKGRDDLFGAGLMDAFEAVSAVTKPGGAALEVSVPAH